MNKTLCKISAVISLFSFSVQAVPLNQVDIGDTYFMNNVFSDNDLVLVKRIDTARGMVKVQYDTGGIDWVNPSRLLTKTKSRDADITETVVGTALVAGALWALFDPDGFEKATMGPKQRQSTHTKPMVSTRKPDKPVRSKLIEKADPNQLGALPTEPTVNGHWSNQGENWVNWASKKLKSKTGHSVAIDSVRTKTLPFYSSPGREVVLAEAKSMYSPGSYFFIAVTGESIVELLGDGGEPIHSFNDQIDLVLSNSDQVREYLKFFASSIASEQGVFQIIDPHSSFLTTFQRKILNANPISIQRRPDGTWNADAMLIYGDCLVEARFEITRNGGVKMLSDKTIRRVNASHVANYVENRLISQKLQTSL
ncbi:hypothetical protein MLD52_15515 [Puniceicoccaceae bacterium K14]|nr:hypothetical protein [Puniceicoccaceae bacterium K14]